MIFTQEMLESMKKVEAAREANIALRAPPHDRRRKGRPAGRSIIPITARTGFGTIEVGPNKGEKAPLELLDMLEANSRVVRLKDIDLDHIRIMMPTC